MTTDHDTPNHDPGADEAYPDEAIDQRHIHDGGPRATSYTPKVGDRMQGAGWDAGHHIDVEYVGRTLFVGTTETGHEVMAYFDDDWVKVEPRPKLAREQWGVIDDRGVYRNRLNETTARMRADAIAPPATLARIINGRVCDEYGTPLDVEGDR